MSKLTRYGERETKFGLWQLLQCDDGEFVKFDDIKEFLPTSAQQTNGAEPAEITPDYSSHPCVVCGKEANCDLKCSDQA